jgi:hypothetical protein
MNVHGSSFCFFNLIFLKYKDLLLADIPDGDRSIYREWSSEKRFTIGDKIDKTHWIRYAQAAASYRQSIVRIRLKVSVVIVYFLRINDISTD